jgi:hypothetical protein
MCLDGPALTGSSHVGDIRDNGRGPLYAAACMAADGTRQPWYNHPWAIATGSAIIAGLIVLYAGKLEPLYVGLALVAFVVVGGGVWLVLGTARSVRRTLGQHRALMRRVLELEHRVLDVALAEVIHDAKERGWEVEWGVLDLSFTSPDDVSEVAPIAFDRLDWRTVAAELHNTSPDNFPVDWMPRVNAMGATAIKHIAALRRDVERLQEREEARDQEIQRFANTLGEVEQALNRRIAQATLADVEADALRQGWDIEWFEDRVEFTKDSNLATVRFYEINVRRLRDALRLESARPG